MFRLSFRNVLAHPGRFLMTTFAVVLGVGFVVGALVVTDTLRAAVTGLFTDVTQGVDLTVRARSGLEGGQLSQRRGRISTDALERVRAVEGVGAAEGNVGGYAQLLDRDGETIASTGAPFLGVAWGRNDELFPVTLASGRKPVGPNEVAIDRGTAEDYRLDVGSRTTALLVGASRPVTVVGIFTFGESNSLLGARLTAFDSTVAQEAFGAPGEWDDIAIALAPGADRAEVAGRVRRVLTGDEEVVTTEAVVDENQESTGELISVFQNVLLGFAGIALFVSAFYINNTFSIVLGQRVREFGLLRAVGAGAEQIRTSVIVEAITVGALASAVGVAAGLGIAKGLTALLAAGGFDLPASGLVLVARTWIAAAVVGMGVTVAASIAPARRAARVSPVTAMTQGLVSGDRRRARIAVPGALLVTSGVALVLLGLFVIDGTALLFGALAIGALAIFLGVARLSPLVAVPVASVLGAPFARLGPSGRLGRANSVRTPDRTARTASALMVGLALVTMVLVVGQSMKRTFSASIDQSVGADFIVTTEGLTGMSPDVARELRALPEVSSASGVRFGSFEVDGVSQSLVAADGPVVGELVDIGLERGSFADLTGKAIFLHRDSARDLGVGVGDHVDAQFAAGGPESLRVAGIYSDATFVGNHLVDLGTLEQFAPTNQLDLMVFVRARSASLSSGRAAIERVIESHPEATLQDRSEYRKAQEDQFDQLLVAVNGLLALALVIALLGIANTLGLSVLERTQELGLLRAVGMSRRQVRSMIVTESLVVSLFGAVLGVLLGLGFGYVVSIAMPESLISTIAVPVTSVVGVVVVSALCGLLAGLLPARRAARLNVLDAIAGR